VTAGPRDLEERLAWLEAKLDGLRAQPAPTMRKDGECPGCHATEILHFTRITERGDGQLHPMALAHPRSMWRMDALAPLQAFVCESCGMVEWYTSDLSKVEVDGTLVRNHKVVKQRDPEGGPYR
jgi:hypothetical protein